VDSLDLVRGAVMVLMALDHVRDFFSDTPIDQMDLRPIWESPALFFTRWVTHFCAPVFVFLAGTAAFLSGARGKTKGQLSWFLLTRGLFLVVMELTVVELGWSFRLDVHFAFVQVIWAIGWSLVALAALVWLPLAAVSLFGLAMVGLHNLFDPVTVQQAGHWGWLWAVLHVPTEIAPSESVHVFVSYPLVPWIGVAAAGYGFGALYRWEPARRRRALLRLGLGLTIGFLVLRATGVYGDPRPWSPQKSLVASVTSFLDCQKYPPSLEFLLMTLGPAILALALLERPVTGRLARVLVVFGRVPFFYYVLHLYLAHGLAVLWAVTHYDMKLLRQLGPMDAPPGWGFGLPAVYAIWLAVVATLYLPCRWFADLKQRRKDTWLSYF